MKKIQVITLLSLLSSGYYAQLGKGAFMLGGSGNYYRSASDRRDSLNHIIGSTNSSTGSNTNLNFGYFVSNKLMIGIIGGYQYDIYVHDYTFGQSATQTMSSFSGGIFLRYYEMIKKSKFGFFCQLNANYGAGQSGNSASGPTTNKMTSTFFNVVLTPGLIYFITNKIGIETSFGRIGYTAQDDKYFTNDRQTNGGNASQLYASFSFSSFYLGLNFYFGRKNENKELPK